MTTTLLKDRVLQLDRWDDPQLTAINGEGVDLAIINRTGFPEVAADALAGLETGSYRDEVSRSDARAVINDILAEMGLDGVQGLSADMNEITERFIEFTGVKRANLRIDLVDRQNCPKMHCDARKVRLITTYSGATTEYCNASDPSMIANLELGAIALLKGTTHPTHRGEYVLHRSPAVQCGQRRLCLVLDY